MGMKLFGLSQVTRTFKNMREAMKGADPWFVGTGTEYAVYVEFGTSKMEAQPYLRPAVEIASSKFDTFEKQALETSQPAQALVKLIALEIERQAKKAVPVDTGNLKDSIEAEKLANFIRVDRVV